MVKIAGIAGDLVKNLSSIVASYVPTPWDDLKLVANLTRIVTTINFKVLCYADVYEEETELRDYCDEHLDDIIRVLPKLKVHIDKYYEPNPYDEDDEEDEWNQFNIEQQCDFWGAVRDVLW